MTPAAWLGNSNLARGQARPGDWMLYLLAALFVARFIWLSAG